MRLDRKFLKWIVFPALILLSFGYMYFNYFCPQTSLPFNKVKNSHPPLSSLRTIKIKTETDILHQLTLNEWRNVRTMPPKVTPVNKINSDILKRDFPFNIEGDDVIVFLHVQKTGGTTFGRHLIEDVNNSNCKHVPHTKRSDCLNSKGHLWLYSRFSTGWTCGLHADWTELQNCVEGEVDRLENMTRPRRFLYVTILREAVPRYLSEWKHVRRGATWENVALKCNGRRANLQEVPFCYESANWEGVSLDHFMECEHNLANNRQARMLANLSKVGCYNKSAMPEHERNRIILESAISNLNDMAYFGLTEFQRESQYLFEKTFKLTFNIAFDQLNLTKAKESLNHIKQSQLDRVQDLNHLDYKLYEYAKKLFFQRLKYFQDNDDDYFGFFDRFTDKENHADSENSQLNF